MCFYNKTNILTDKLNFILYIMENLFPQNVWRTDGREDKVNHEVASLLKNVFKVFNFLQ